MGGQVGVAGRRMPWNLPGSASVKPEEGDTKIAGKQMGCRHREEPSDVHQAVYVMKLI